MEHLLKLRTKNGGFGPSTLYSLYEKDTKYDIPHIVFTFSALNCLHAIGGL